jgi:hypothetical protein
MKNWLFIILALASVSATQTIGANATQEYPDYTGARMGYMGAFQYSYQSVGEKYYSVKSGEIYPIYFTVWPVRRKA